MHKILLVEDEKVLREAYTILLEAQEGINLTTASNGQEALDLCKDQVFDLILLDLMMPILDGVGFLKSANLEATAPHTRVVIMSNLSSGDAVTDAMTLGAHRHAVKSDLAPMDVINLIQEELSYT
jgi:DNA-binding NarL/FixJ family response regulator